MDINIEVNNKTIQAKRDDTILTALQRNGIKIPTLCNIQNFSPTGACRMCVVELEGKENLVPACSYPVSEWMKIKTHSNRVIRARQTIIEMLLANHPDDCLYCSKNGSCELQNLAKELHIDERHLIDKDIKQQIDQSSPSITYDTSKCILCSRCVRICEEVQHVSTIDFCGRGNSSSIKTAMDRGFNLSNCIFCGQCIRVCPTGALHERNQLNEVLEALQDSANTLVAQYDSTAAVSLSESFGIRMAKNISGLLNNALRKIGFDAIFDSGFGADLAIIEHASELQERIEENKPLPLLSSTCPSWVKYVEQWYPDLIPHLSACKSPQLITGSLIKNYWAQQEGINAKNIVSVAITSCTAKKFEIQREEVMQKGGLTDVDIVLTTRELIELLRITGIDIANINEESADTPMNTRSFTGKLIDTGGGLTEGVIRTFAHNLGYSEQDESIIKQLRGLKNHKETTITFNETSYHLGAFSTLEKARSIMAQIQDNTSPYHMVEMMTCVGGCLGGGGQPFNTDLKLIKARLKSLYKPESFDMINTAYQNPIVNELYENYLGDRTTEKYKRMLHTRYKQRNVLL